MISQLSKQLLPTFLNFRYGVSSHGGMASRLRVNSRHQWMPATFASFMRITPSIILKTRKTCIEYKMVWLNIYWLICRDEIAKKFGGREEVLKAKLQKKYGVAPALQSIRPQQIVQAVVKAVATYDPNYRRITCPRVSSSMDCRSKAFDPLQLLLKPVQRSTATTPLDNLSKCRYLVGICYTIVSLLNPC